MKHRLPAPIPVDLSVSASAAELPFQGAAYRYDSAGGTGPISGGTVLSGPNQGSPTGSVTGGTILPVDTRYD